MGFKSVLVAAATVAAVGCGAYFVWLRSSSDSKSKDDTNSKKDSKSNNVSGVCPLCFRDAGRGKVVLCDRCDGALHLGCLDHTPSATDAEWFCPSCRGDSCTSLNGLKYMIDDALSGSATPGESSFTINPDVITERVKALSSLSPSTVIPDDLRIAAAMWMYTICASLPQQQQGEGDETDAAASMGAIFATQKPNLESALQLLRGASFFAGEDVAVDGVIETAGAAAAAPESAKERTKFELLRLDLARIVKDVPEMIKMIDVLLKKRDVLAAESDGCLSLFGTLPVVGRWEDFIAMKDIIDEFEQKLGMLHSAALDNALMIDFCILFQKASVLQQTNALPLTPSPSSLKFQALSVTNMREKYSSVESPDMHQWELTAAQIPKDWKDVPLTNKDQGHLLRVGAVAHWVIVPGGGQGIPVSGTFDDDRITLEGVVHIQMQGIIAIHTQQYELKPSPSSSRPNRWSGTHIVAQMPISEGAPPALAYKLVFETEMDLAVDDSTQWKALLA